MKNTLREEQETPVAGARKKKALGSYLNRLFNGEFLAREGMIRHLPFIGFLVFLFMLHISMMYYYENTERAIVKTKKELDAMRSGFLTTTSKLESKGLQSTVATEVAPLGLQEPTEKPEIIYVNEDFLEEN
jgi:Bacteriodetes cell division protein (FtsL-like)